MTMLAALFDFSFLELNWGSPLVMGAIVIALVALAWFAIANGKKKDGGEGEGEGASTPTSNPPKPSDLKESLRSLASVVNFIGVPDGAIILTDLSAGDYANAPRAARALATKLDTPEGRKALIRGVIEKHAHLFADDPAIVSRFASVVGKQKR